MRNYFNRPEPVDQLENFRKENGDYSDFGVANVTEKRQFTAKSGRLMLVLQETKAKDNIHLCTAESLSSLQEKNPERKIMINAKGKVAKVGEPCIVNEAELIGRSNGSLVLG